MNDKYRLLTIAFVLACVLNPAGLATAFAQSSTISMYARQLDQLVLERLEEAG